MMGSLRFRDLGLVGIAAAFWPLNIVSINLVGIVHPERLVALVVPLWAVSLAAVLTLIRLGVSRSAAVHSIFVTTVIFMIGGGLIRLFDEGVGYGALLGVGILTIWLINRLDGETLVVAVIWGGAVALLSGPVIGLYESLTNFGESVVVRSEKPDLTMNQTPDVFLIVLDGYPGALAMTQDGFGEHGGVVDELESAGFEVPDSAWSSYWTTGLAIPSILDMGYPATRRWEGTATWKELFEIISGGSWLHQVLEANGYTNHLVESGWTGSACGLGVHRCVPSPLMDEAMHQTLRNSVISPVFRDFAGPFVEGALASMKWLIENGQDLGNSGTPDFVFAHVMAPHPPFVLDADCAPNISLDRAGTTFNVPGVSEQRRERYMQEQIECVNEFMSRFASSVGHDSVIVFVADHGSDRRDQAQEETTEWSDEAVIERLNVFLAVRAPGNCRVGDQVLTSNLLRTILNCYSATDVQLNPPRMWVNPMTELEAVVVDRLLASSPGS